MFASLSLKNSGYVTFKNNNKGKIIGIGNVGKEPSPIIENVLLVDGLKHNFLSINQLGYMELVNKENKQKYLLNRKISFSPLGHYNFYTWI